MKQRTWKICLSLVIAVLLILGAFGLKHVWDDNVTRQVKKIYALPTDTTATDLEKAGYINLSSVQPQKVKAVSDFLENNTASGKTLLKTFAETEDGTFIRLFQYDKANLMIILVSNYCVQGQYEQSPNQPFRPQADYIEKDGITEVWLKGLAYPWATDRVSEDFLLYRYESK